MPALVLDSEALSVLAHSSGRDELRRVRARLAVAGGRGWPVRVPAVVLAELYRTPAHSAAVDAALSRYGIRPLTTGQGIARHTGRLLERNGLDTCHLVDAAVVATTIRSGGGVIVTADVDDLTRLAANDPNVVVTAI